MPSYFGARKALTAVKQFGSIQFAATQSVTIPNNALFAFGTGDFTVEAWIYINAGSGDFNVFNAGTALAGSYSFYWLAATQKFESVRYGDIAGSGRTTNTYSTGQWLHMAATRASGTARLYINGVSDAGATYAMGSVTAGTAVNLGSIWNGASTNNGYITNLRVVTGTAVYTTNFTPPTSPLPVIPNTSLLLLSSTSASLLNDSSTNNFILTNNGPTIWSPYSPLV
jgi:Concanavalin A-like lectin/glucanases superfamily